MNYEDEHYVRLYTRDTKTWLKLGWEGQAVLSLLLRKVDKAGVLDDVDDPVPDISLITGVPEGIVEIALPRLLRVGKDGQSTIEIVGSKLVFPNYIEAQTAIRSDKVRAQEYRGRRRAQARHVTPPPDASHTITENHEPSRSVTSESDDASHSVTDENDGVTDSHDESRAVTPASPYTVQRYTTLEDPPIPPAGGETDALRVRSRLFLQGRCDAQTIALAHGEPFRWVEVIATLRAFQEHLGTTQEVRTSGDSRVHAILAWFAAGYDVLDLVEVFRLAAKDAFWRDKPLVQLLKSTSRLDELRQPRAKPKPKPGNGPRQPNNPNKPKRIMFTLDDVKNVGGLS